MPSSLPADGRTTLAIVLMVRVSVTTELADAAERVLRDGPSLVTLSRFRGASVDPAGDVITAMLERDAVNDIVEELISLGVPRDGCILIQDPGTWVSEQGLKVQEASPDADNIVWPEVIEQAYAQSKITPMFLTFMIMATLLAAIAVITNSPILVIGAMVLGPEFMAVIALGLALVRRRRTLFKQAIVTLIIGFTVSILATMAFVALARMVGLVSSTDVYAPRPDVAFIYTPNWWSLLVAIIAAAAGVLAITSSRSMAIVGVFISVTTIPASGNVAVAAVFGNWDEVAGSAAQLGINITGMAVAGWLTLALRQVTAERVSRALARRGRRKQSAQQ
jgi:uncharacterized hydrophobic protein (TIGR00271 family)